MIEKIQNKSEFESWTKRDIFSVRILSILESYGCKYQFASYFKQVIDGEITAIDAQNTLIAYVEALTNDGETGLTEVQFKACDVDGDGEITAADAQYILIYYTENNVAGNPITWDAIVKK